MELTDIRLRIVNFLRYLRKPRWFRLYISDRFITPNYTYAQYFFTSECASDLVDKLDHFNNPCCLCTPRLAQEWFDRGRIVRVLDIDKRFIFLPGYKYYDMREPEVLDEEFDVIIADPIYNWEEAVLLRTINTLSKQNYSQKLLVVYYTNKKTSFLETFQDYGLKQTSYYPKYSSVQEEAAEKRVMCYSNFKFP